MKKILIIIILFFVLIILFPKHEKITSKIEEKQIFQEKRAVFFSYIELEEYVKNQSNDQSKQNIDNIINNLANFNFNMLILQVRSFSDAIYKSKLFPWSNTVSIKEGEDPGYDILDYFIKQAHKKKIEVHAWVNPYRIRNTKDINTISNKNKASEWLNTNNVKICDKGIYYNPASEDVQNLIVEGIKEIINNYDIDGIHFDDYFYPDATIDNENYNDYLKNNKKISLEQYHLLMVNNLIKKVHKVTKAKQVLFGISPEGNINNNYNSNFADVYQWGSSNDYVDYLMPQIYYGFFNESQPFYEVLKVWNNLVKDSNVKIIPALALYKTGTIDTYAKSGANEWIENNNIIMKQVLASRNTSNYDGFAIFRYNSVFQTDNQTINTIEEIKNLKKIMVNY